VVERRVESSGGGASGTWTRIAKLPNTATQYSDSTLKKGDNFAYRIRAINSDGESAYSNVARSAVSLSQ
jgi:hypothetical protein